MTSNRIHPDQIDIDTALVRRLLSAQFPDWADLPLVAVPTAGTENAIYRLGNEMAVRLPYRPVNDDQIDKLEHWLPILAARLPLPIPSVLARGAPTDAYPAAWSIVRWLTGEEATLDRLTNPVLAAGSLAAFVTALRASDATGAPTPGEHNFWRGVPLAARDGTTRACIRESAGLIDAEAVTRAWDQALLAPAWDGPPAWLHGDLAPDNLLVRGGRLSAVIDWGGLAAGDPATDLLPAWNLFHGASRDAYRNALGADEAAWARGRGLALSISIVALPYYLDTIPVRAQRAHSVIREVLADVAREP
jgi:aminoglycoside phosphotransferase (APT) family kinase protein